jgi:hypothetical protein
MVKGHSITKHKYIFLVFEWFQYWDVWYLDVHCNLKLVVVILTSTVNIRKPDCPVSEQDTFFVRFLNGFGSNFAFKIWTRHF